MFLNQDCRRSLSAGQLAGDRKADYTSSNDLRQLLGLAIGQKSVEICYRMGEVGIGRSRIRKQPRESW